MNFVRYRADKRIVTRVLEGRRGSAANSGNDDFNASDRTPWQHNLGVPGLYGLAYEKAGLGPGMQHKRCLRRRTVLAHQDRLT